MSLSDAHASTLNLLPEVPLKRADSAGPAGLLICSLPVPPGASPSIGMGDRPTYVKALGQWPGHHEAAPRRLLMVADGAAEAPDVLPIGDGSATISGTPPAATMTLVERSSDRRFVWERHALQLNWEGKELQLMLGLRTGGEIRWWEACGLEVEEETPFCRTVHMSGSIPRELTTAEMLEEEPGYNFPLIHVHNWLTGHLWVRLYANGVCEIFARHVNGRFVDDGLDLEDVVPIIGIRCSDPADLPGVWDGTRSTFALDGIAYDVTETARLATPERPGEIRMEGEWLAWQPYMGVEVYSGRCATEVIGRPWIWRAEERFYPRGMTRTFRFSCSLGDRSPRIARYLPPLWWYALNAELQHDTLLPVANQWNESHYASLRKWLHAHVIDGGFEDGAIPRGGPMPPLPAEPERYEAGWEGDAPHGMLNLAWMTGDGVDFSNTLRNIYHFSDICIDHGSHLVRMHGYPPVAFAQPGYRVIGTIMGYLETGDTYLLDAAEAVIENAWRNHQGAWPRLAVGRDACFIRGATLLYRYFNNDHFRRIAHRACHHVALSQRPDGSFGDQGGGAGIHGWGGYITKPWMAMLATTPLLDFLELFPDEQPLIDCIRKTGDWLMRIRFKHDDGITGWSYQHDYAGGPDFWNYGGKSWTKLPGTSKIWHMDNLARVLAYCSLTTGDGAYLDAWAENGSARGEGWGDHSVSATLLTLPRLQAWLIKARWNGGDITIQPFHYGERMPKEAVILAPNGEHRLRWEDDQTLACPAGVRQLHEPQSTVTH